MRGNTAIAILSRMLDHPERIRPWEAREVSDATLIPPTTVYRNLRILQKHGLISRTTRGYILGNRILDAGAKYHGHMAVLKTTGKLQEELYGKPE